MSKKSNDYFDEVELKTLNLEYESAQDILKTHLEVLISNYEMQKGGIKSVEHSNTRLKNITSAVKKLIKRDCEISASELEQSLNDMVGIRLVCPFFNDVYEMVDLIKKSDLIEVYKEKDYIESPKKSGYRSYHLLVRVPVKINGKIKKVKAEIQIRTLSMDAFAAMEHRIKYKPTGKKELTDREKEMLIFCAKALQLIEEYMRNLVPKTDLVENTPKEKMRDFYSMFTEDEIKQFNFEYSSALKILNTHVDVIMKEHDLIKGTKTVEHTNSRLKVMPSIFRKLSEKGFEMNMKNIEENINDVAAIRYVCPFMDDLYDLVNIIKESDFIKVYEERDYIKNPKESGYRGYHLLVYVPVPVGDEIKMVKAEIQIRTLAMDAWAAMEERIKYNKDNKKLSNEQKSMLEICARTFAEVEDYMNKLLNGKTDVNETNSSLDEYFGNYRKNDSDKTLEKKKK